MPFLSFLPAIKYFGHFQNPDTFVVDIYLLPAVDFAMGIGHCVNDDLLNELMQDTGVSALGYRCTGGQRTGTCQHWHFCLLLLRFLHGALLPASASYSPSGSDDSICITYYSKFA